MDQNGYDVLICASVLPEAGLNYNLFLSNLPNDEMVLASIPLLTDGSLRLDGDNLTINWDRIQPEDLTEHENTAVLMDFLGGLLAAMYHCERAEENEDFISVLHTLQNACERFSGRSESLDDQLAALLAALADMLEDPCFHFVSREMVHDNKEYLSVLCSAEEILVLKMMERAYDADEKPRQLKNLRFVYASLKAISYAHHYWLGENEATEQVDQLIDLIANRIVRLEVYIKMEEALAEWAREFGGLDLKYT